MCEEEELRAKKQEEEEAERRKIEEEKAAANAPKGKPPPKKAAEAPPPRTGSRTGISSAGSQHRQSRDQDLINEILKKNALNSVDDEEKQFGFKSFERAMSQMECSSTNIGGILAAMIYQIEEDNGG